MGGLDEFVKKEKFVMETFFQIMLKFYKSCTKMISTDTKTDVNEQKKSLVLSEISKDNIKNLKTQGRFSKKCVFNPLSFFSGIAQ